MLKPCPFCGKPVVMVYKNGDWGYTSATLSIRCHECGISFIEQAEKFVKGRGTVCIRGEAEERLKKRWDTRH